MSGIVVSTLLVLLAKSNEELRALWERTGSMNDATGNKHQWPIKSAISEGNFRSALIDTWDFDMMRIYGVNTQGDILWAAVLNVTGSTKNLTSWLLPGRILLNSEIKMMTDVPSEFTLSTNNYNYRQHVAGNKSLCWFAISVAHLSYGPLPVMFGAKSATTPFTCPSILNGSLGCWDQASMLNWTFNADLPGVLTPTVCINSCGSSFMAAVLVFGTKCYCANYTKNSPPVSNSGNCYIQCPGDSTMLCGGYILNSGSAYHIQGVNLPGSISSSVLFNNIFLGPISDITLQGSDLSSATPPVIITDVIVVDSVNTTYTIQYSENPCSVGDVQTYPEINGNKHVTNGSVVQLEVLRIDCLILEFAAPLVSVEITILGLPASASHIEIPVTVIQGVKYIPTTTTTTSSTTTSTTSTSTTPTSTATTTTTVPSTTTSTTTQTTPTTTTTTATTTSTTTPFTTHSSTTTASPSSTISTTLSTDPATTTSTHAPISTTHSNEIITSSAATSSDPSSSTASPASSTTPACLCPCSSSNKQLNYTQRELVEKVVEIQKRLAVNTSELSATIRKLTSAEDDRPSAVSIGLVGVGIMASVFGTIVIFDSGMILRDLRKFCSNIRSAFSSQGY